MKTKPKILVLTSSFPRYPTDWWAQFVLNTYAFLPEKKYDVTVIAPHAPSAELDEIMNGLEVKRFPYFYPLKYEKLTSGEGILHNRGDLISRMQIFGFLIAQLIFFLWSLAKKEYDIVHAHWILPQGLFALFAKLFFNKPVIVTVHGSDVFGLQKLDFLKAFVLKYVDYCTVNSKATYDAVLHLYPKTQVILIPMGVDIGMFYPRKEEVKRSTRTILAVGRLISCKGFRYLIQALPLIKRTLRDVRVVIVGSGPQEAYLRKLARRLKLEQSIIFFGNLRHKELAQMYRDSSIFVAPAVTDPVTGEREAQGLAIIEAMACGLPIVASRSGGIQYIVQDKKTGILVPEKDISGIAREVVNLFQNNAARQSLVKAAVVATRKEYSWQAVSKKFDSLFTEILEKQLQR